MKKVFFIGLATFVYLASLMAEELNNNSAQRFYRSYIELSGVITSYQMPDITVNSQAVKTSSIVEGGIALDFVNGCQLNKYVFVGAGIGAHSMFFDYTPSVSNGNATQKLTDVNIYQERIASPIFADVRAYLPLNNQKVLPYAELAVGPLFQYHQYQKTTIQTDPSEPEIITHYADFSTHAFFRVGIGIDFIDRFTIGAGYELWGDKDDTSNCAYLKLGVRIGNGKGLY